MHRDAALLKSLPLYFHRGQSAAFNATLAAEEEAWDEHLRRSEAAEQASNSTTTFEEYRKAGAAGF